MALVKYRCGPAYPGSVIKKCNWLDMSPGPSVVVGSWALSKPSLIFIGPKIKARIICLPESELRPRPITKRMHFHTFSTLGWPFTYIYIYMPRTRLFNYWASKLLQDPTYGDENTAQIWASLVKSSLNGKTHDQTH